MCKSLRISIADDEPDIRDYLARILPRLGHQVVSAADNGRQLVADFQRLSPDLIITDVRMPELDGLSAIEEIRRDRPVPVIFISAHQDSKLLTEPPAGTTLILTKPIDRQVLQDAIAGLMDGDRAASAAVVPARFPRA
jgi:two-component system, response regulator PdtaR